MAPKIQLYMTPGSCALASHIALQESGLGYTITDLKARRGFPSEYLYLNPKGKVPILDLDGEIITEGLAIVNTISALAPEKKLLGSTLIENARAQEWLSYLTGSLHGQGFGMLFRPGRFVEDEKLHDFVKAKGVSVIKEYFTYIEGKLEGRTHAVGDAFTAVDAYLLVFYRWGNMMKFGMRKDYPHYTKLVEEVITRDAVKTALDDEGITPLEEAAS